MRLYSAKEPYNFMEPTHRRHPIVIERERMGRKRFEKQKETRRSEGSERERENGGRKMREIDRDA